MTYLKHWRKSSWVASFCADSNAIHNTTQCLTGNASPNLVRTLAHALAFADAEAQVIPLVADKVINRLRRSESGGSMLYLVPDAEPLMPASPLSARLDELLGQLSGMRVSERAHPAWAHAYHDELSNSSTPRDSRGGCHQISSVDALPVSAPILMSTLARRRIGTTPDFRPDSRLGWTIENDRWKAIKDYESNQHVALRCASNDILFSD